MNTIIAVLRGAILSLAFVAGTGVTAPATPGPRVTIRIKDFAFQPAVLVVHAGDRVTFVNDDDEAHTVTADDKTFDSGGLDSAQTWQHVFAKPGTYHYFCELHPYMKATVIAR
jgi:plastocyanin